MIQIHFWLIIIFPSVLCAQYDCELILREAQSNFNKGNFNQVVLQLDSCSKSSALDKSIRIEIFELMGQSYLEMKDRELALDNSYFPILRIKKTYVPDPGRVSPDWVDMTQDFHTHPVFSVHLYTGFNAAKPIIKETFDLDSVTTDEEAYRAFFLKNELYGLGLSYSPHRSRFDFSLEAMYKKSQYNYNGNYRNASVFSNGDYIREFGLVAFSEELTWVSFPFVVKYNTRLPELSYRPIFVRFYGLGGGSIDWVRNATIDNLSIAFPAVNKIVFGEKLNLNAENKLRKSINYQVFLGVGIKLYIASKFTVFSEYRIGKTIGNIVSEKNRFSSDTLQDPFNYIDNDFNLNNQYLLIGAGYSFFKSKKK